MVIQNFVHFHLPQLLQHLIKTSYNICHPVYSTQKNQSSKQPLHHKTLPPHKHTAHLTPSFFFCSNSSFLFHVFPPHPKPLLLKRPSSCSDNKKRKCYCQAIKRAHQHDGKTHPRDATDVAE